MNGAEFLFEYQCGRRDFSNQIVTSGELTGKNLSGCNLYAAKINNLVLNKSDLSRSWLAHADFINTSMIGTNLSGSNLGGAVLLDANMERADLSNCFLKHTNFCGANLIGVNFSRASWFSLIGDDGVMTENIAPAIFDHQTRIIPPEWDNLFFRPQAEQIVETQQRFVGWQKNLQFDQMYDQLGLPQRMRLKAIMAATPEKRLLAAGDTTAHDNQIQIITAAESARFNLYGDLDSRALRQSIESHDIPIIQGRHVGQDFTSITRPMDGVFITQADLRHADLPKKSLRQAVISHSNLADANLAHCDLQDAILINVDLSRADLRHSNLRGAIFVNCHLDGTLLDGVVIDGTRMAQSTLENITITQAHITDWLIERSEVKNIAFDGGIGHGIHIDGFGLYDSLMYNARFSGDTTIRPDKFEVMGSLLIADTNNLLETRKIHLSPSSIFRDQRLHYHEDDILGLLRSEIFVEKQTIPLSGDKPGLAGFWQWMHKPIGEAFAEPMGNLTVFDLVTDTKGPMAKLPVVEHLAWQPIGYQPALILLGNKVAMNGKRPLPGLR